jgi:hypothetical protein
MLDPPMRCASQLGWVSESGPWISSFMIQSYYASQNDDYFAHTLKRNCIFFSRHRLDRSSNINIAPFPSINGSMDDVLGST